MPYGLGIDLGTCCTVAAVSHSDTWPNIVPLGRDGPGVPTVLHIADDGTTLAGEAAELLVVSDPDRVFRGFLHRVGEPATLEPSPRGPVRRPAALTARLVRWVVDAVIEREGEQPRRITLAHPAVWGPGECRLLDGALTEFGLPGVVLVPAPVAAATGAMSVEQTGDPVAVYDLGATFSASIVCRDGAGFTILGEPQMIEDGGGARFDEVVLAHVLDDLGDQVATADLDDQATLAGMSRLLSDCVAAREALSGHSEVAFLVSLPGVSACVRLTRSKLATLIDSTLRATVASLHAVISAAGLTPADVGTVLVVGGCARIPEVAQLLNTEFGRHIEMLADPELAVARGSALIAAQPDLAANPRAQPALPAVLQIPARQPPADLAPVNNAARRFRLPSTHQLPAGWCTRGRKRALLGAAAGILTVTLTVPITLLSGPESGAGLSAANGDGSVRQPSGLSRLRPPPADGGAVALPEGSPAPTRARSARAPAASAPPSTFVASPAPGVPVSLPRAGTVESNGTHGERGPHHGSGDTAASPAPTLRPTPTPRMTPTPSPTPRMTPTPSPTPSPTPRMTPTPSPTLRVTPTPPPTPRVTPTPLPIVLLPPGATPLPAALRKPR